MQTHRTVIDGVLLFAPTPCRDDRGFFSRTFEAADTYRIDREHAAGEDVAVRFDDPDLAVRWPLPVSAMSGRDAAAGSWAELCERLGVVRDAAPVVGARSAPTLPTSGPIDCRGRSGQLAFLRGQDRVVVRGRGRAGA